MPMNRKLYPRDWDDIARRVKDRAGWRCEECYRPCRRPGESWPELVERLYAIDFRWYAQAEKPGRFTLTVAHLDCNPQNCDPSNLRALCPACHLRHDLDHHIRTRRANRHRRREASGQLTLFDSPDPLQ